MARWAGYTDSNVIVEFFQQTLIRLSAKLCGRIVTLSEFSRNEILRITGVAAQKIVIIHTGVRLGDYINELVPAKNVVDGQYIIAVGSIEKRKNQMALIKAFENANLPCKLLFIGKPGDAYDEISSYLSKNSALRAAIVIPGYVSQPEMVYLVKHALFYVTTTLYEGAGMATLEIMSTGKAAVASAIPPLKEYLGDACIYVDPKSVESIAQGIKLLYTDNNLRKRLEKEGVEQAKKFSWNDYAKDLIKILEK